MFGFQASTSNEGEEKKRQSRLPSGVVVAPGKSVDSHLVQERVCSQNVELVLGVVELVLVGPRRLAGSWQAAHHYHRTFLETK